MNEITHVTLLMILFTGAVWDYRKQEIPLLLPVFGICSGVLFHILSGFGSALAFASGFLPGLLLLAAGFLSKEAVGYGDGAMLLCVGSFLTFSETLLMTILSLLFSAACAGILMAAKRIKRKGTFPFLPFLLAGYVAVLAG